LFPSYHPSISLLSLSLPSVSSKKSYLFFSTPLAFSLLFLFFFSLSPYLLAISFSPFSLPLLLSSILFPFLSLSSYLLLLLLFLPSLFKKLCLPSPPSLFLYPLLFLIFFSYFSLFTFSLFSLCFLSTLYRERVEKRLRENRHAFF
jgi:hypothetical protein